jgi:hypothetical protein
MWGRQNAEVSEGEGEGASGGRRSSEEGRGEFLKQVELCLHLSDTTSLSLFLFEVGFPRKLTVTLRFMWEIYQGCSQECLRRTECSTTAEREVKPQLTYTRDLADSWGA